MDTRTGNPPPYLIGVSLVLLACHAVSLHASQSPQQFAARADAVRLDVSVLGRDKQPMRGLTAADFTILEDGKPRPITTFAEVSLPDREGVTTSWIRDIAPDVFRNEDTSDHRLMVLILDDALIPQSLPAFVNSTKDIGRGLVERMGPRDLVAVVYTRDNRKTQSFTRDRTKLLASIEAFVGGPHEPTVMLYPNSIAAAIEKSRAFETIRTLEGVVDALETIPDRRKSITFVSLGIPVDALEISPGKAGPGDPAYQIVSDMKELFRRAERANVNIYSVDPGGFDGLRGIFERSMAGANANSQSMRAMLEERTTEALRLYRDFLLTLSDYSGGRAFINTNEFETGVTQIFRDTGHYYLIGYEPANAKADGRFRRVEARVGRPDATVRSRRGYFAERPARDLLPPPSTVSALEGLLPKSDLPLVAAVAPFAAGQDGRQDGRSTVAIALGLPAPVPGGPADKVAVLLNAYDVNGTERATQRFTATVALPATVQGSTFEVVASLDLPPGRYELRLSADSAARGKAGSVYADLDVPDFHKAPLTMSGVVVGVVPATPRAVAPGVTALVPLAPTVQRSFSAAETVTAFLRIYQGGDASAMPVALNTRIVDSANATVFGLPKTIGSDEFGVARSHDHTFTVPIGQLKPGEHVLIFEARVGRDVVRRNVRFIVR